MHGRYRSRTMAGVATLMAKKKINTFDLVTKIEKLTKSRMKNQEVVSLDQFRDLKNRVEPKMILVIEDDEAMRSSLKRIFESDGYQVRTAADGTELSSTLDDIPPDLIVLDIGLPWINGLELGQMLKEHADLRKIPLVFISGIATSEDMQRAFAIGADEFVQKPFEMDDLKKIISDLLASPN